MSRREKFGYGVMVTQVAATGAGAMALQRSGMTDHTAAGRGQGCVPALFRLSNKVCLQQEHAADTSFGTHARWCISTPVL